MQKHRFTDGDKPGEENPCPIEYRNVFIKEIEPGTVDVPAKPRGSAAEDRTMSPVKIAPVEKRGCAGLDGWERLHIALARNSNGTP